MKYSWLKNAPICNKGLFDNNQIIENTLPAIKKAVDCGYNLIVNIAMTKDKQLVVCDSRKASILLSYRKKISTLTYDKLEQIKLMSTDNKVPLLLDVLKAVDAKVGIIFRLQDTKSFKPILIELAKLLAFYKGNTAVVADNYKMYFYVKKIKKDYPCGVIFKKSSSKFISNAVLLANATIFKLIKPCFIICNVNNLPNKYLDSYLAYYPYSYIISRTILDKQSYQQALEFSDNYIFENYLSDDLSQNTPDF